MLKTFLKSTAMAVAIVGVGGAMAVAAPAETPMSPTSPMAPATVPFTDLSTPNFIRVATQSNEFEIKEGRLAERDGTPSVRRFGERMVRDHTKVGRAFALAVKDAGMPLPSAGLTTDQTQMISQIDRLHGRAFDRAYLRQAVASHKEALGLLEAYAMHGDAPPLVKAARKTIPMVKSHLAAAEHLTAEQGGET